METHPPGSLVPIRVRALVNGTSALRGRSVKVLSKATAGVKNRVRTPRKTTPNSGRQRPGQPSQESQLWLCLSNAQSITSHEVLERGPSAVYLVPRPRDCQETLGPGFPREHGNNINPSPAGQGPNPVRGGDPADLEAGLADHVGRIVFSLTRPFR